MKFDVYYPFEPAEGVVNPGIDPVQRSFEEILIISSDAAVKDLITRHRQGEENCKKRLPAVTWSGVSNSKRANSAETPTQLVMVDVDHIKDTFGSVQAVKRYLEENEDMRKRSVIWHITPSGKGIRGVFWAYEDLKTIEENQHRVRDLMKLSSLGDFDKGVHDFARLSFMPMREEIFFTNTEYLESGYPYEGAVPLVNLSFGEEEGKAVPKYSVPDFTEEEIEKFDKFDYRGTPLKVIVEKYIEGGEPSTGEIHNYYNENG